MLRLNTQKSTTPFSSQFGVISELGLEVLLEQLQLRFIFSLDVGQGDGGGGLLVDQLSQLGFTLNEAVRNVSSSAKLGQPDDQLNGVNVVSNND